MSDFSTFDRFQLDQCNQIFMEAYELCDTPMQWVLKRCEKDLIFPVVGSQKETDKIR